MRIAVIMLTLIIAGCASGPGSFAGKHAKNGGPVRVERLGVMTTSELPRHCGASQVKWCAGSGPSATCKCILVQNAKRRVRHMADRMRQSAIHH